ncbi:MAG: hypothetical protein HOD72_10935 [Opitutae bacterium]|jgi:hypothetical protein|nr:hypothetical protein [Opitutae bacterium]MBT5378795.1 hypothetical protein [Opitutae bacterium]MBT6959113.1 hypothetical protein [Opitutae bacterium]MBT7853646.1 hypothetical protein [Opitutae bacterium]
MDLISILASVEKEPSVFDGIVGMILGSLVCGIVMWCSMLLVGMKLRIRPNPDEALEDLIHNEDLVNRRPWIIWVVGIASVGSLAGTFLWYCGGKVPSVY